MYERIKSRVEKNLVDEIKNLSSQDIEFVGHHLIQNIEKERIIHKGLDKRRNPVGYTVDSISQNASIIGEYSATVDYFCESKDKDNTICYKKIRNDIKHAHKHGKGCLEKIYLISNQEEPSSFRKKFNGTDDFKNNKDIIIIMDARQLAEEIYKQSLDREDDLNFYGDYFPNFLQEMENYEYYGKIPAHCEKYCKDMHVLNEIERYFNDNNICWIHGLSGSGKTQAVIEYVHYKADEFPNYIWISGDDWAAGSSLSAIKRTRGGVPINVVGMFNKIKTILVIDSLERDVDYNEFSEMDKGFDKGGRIIITSQIKASWKKCMQMPELSKEVALKILDDEGNEKVARKIVDKCKGFPIILSTIRNMIIHENVNKNDLYDEVIETPGEIIASNGEALFKKILSKLEKRTYEKLVKIANTGLTTFDIDFLRFYCGCVTCNALQKLSLLILTNIPGIVKIHDLICVVVKEMDDSYDDVEKLRCYIESKKGEMTSSVLRQIYLMRHKVAQYKSVHPEVDWLTYALLQIEGDEKTKIAEKICNQIDTSNMDLVAAKCLIETDEIIGYKEKSKDGYKRYNDMLIEKYTNYLQVVNDEEIVAEFLHHLGKAYRRGGNLDGAFKCFKDLLKIKPDWSATYSQIVTLGTNKGVKDNPDIYQEAEKYMRVLLDTMISNPTQIPLRVALATISRMRSFRKIVNEVINTNDKVEKICQIVASAGIEDIGQFFEGFVAVTSLFNYHYSETCIRLARSVPEIIMVLPQMIDNKQWINACEALTNIATYVDKENNNQLFTILIEKAVEFGEEWKKQGLRDDYGGRAVAKAYIINGDGVQALSMINQIPIEKRSHWVLYRQAEAENMIGDKNASLTAQKAIDLLKDDAKSTDRQPSYYHLLGKCFRDEGDIDKALKAITNAIDLCCDSKYKEELENFKLQILEI